MRIPIDDDPHPVHARPGSILHRTPLRGFRLIEVAIPNDVPSTRSARYDDGQGPVASIHHGTIENAGIGSPWREDVEAAQSGLPPLATRV